MKRKKPGCQRGVVTLGFCPKLNSITTSHLKSDPFFKLVDTSCKNSPHSRCSTRSRIDIHPWFPDLYFWISKVFHRELPLVPSCQSHLERRARFTSLIGPTLHEMIFIWKLSGWSGWWWLWLRLNYHPKFPFYNACMWRRSWACRGSRVVLSDLLEIEWGRFLIAAR